MTLPRRVIPNTSWFITRRCSERRFFLMPTFYTKKVFEYALARAARITGVQLHAWMVMSNHYHLVLTDPEGRLPEFIRLLNSLVARALNCHYKRKESFWKSGSYNAVQLCTTDAVIDKMVYTLMNPVAAGLVRHAWLWEGSSSLKMSFGGVAKALRPGFVKTGDEFETLRLVAPPNMPLEQLVDKLKRGLDDRKKEIHAQFEAEGRRFLEMQDVRAQSWQASANSEERFGAIVPRFATKDAKEMKRVLREWRSWLGAYRLALAAFRDGARDVVFPAGTYLMKERFDVNVAVL